MNPPSEVTAILRAHESGDETAFGRLLPLVYEELRGLAQHVFVTQKARHTLQPTALAHEAWIKLSGGMHGVTGRHHFFAVAARAMRQVLTDHARAAQRERRHHVREFVTLSGIGDEQHEGLDLVLVHDLLQRLEQLHSRHARVVELRVFGGLTIPETADVLGVSEGTVDNDWAAARAWLARELLQR